MEGEDKVFFGVKATVVVQDKGNTNNNNPTVGLAFLNPNTNTLSACEFVDDDHLCALEVSLLQVGAHQCAYAPPPSQGQAQGQGGKGLESRLKDVFERCSIKATVINKVDSSHLEGDLERLVCSGYVEHCREVLDRKVAASALAGLLAHTELLADTDNYNKWEVVVHENKQYMRLDAAAMKALNVIPSGRESASESSESTFSLSGLMSRGKTSMGRRLAKTWLKQPLLNREEIEMRLNVVEVFTSDLFLRETVRDQYLRGLPDIDKLVRKLEKKKITLYDLCNLYRASGRLPLIGDALKGYKGKHSDVIERRYIRPLSEHHSETHLLKFEELLEAAIDLDRVPDEYLITPQYSEELEELFREKVETEAQIRNEAEDIADDLNLVLDKSIKMEWRKLTNTRTRCMRITSKEEKAVRKQLQSKYIVLETRKDGTKFTNRALKKAAEKLNAITKEYDGKQRELVEAVVNVAHSYVNVWQSVSKVLAEMDALAGFADLAVSAPKPFVKPKILSPEGGRLVLKGSRHPCVEAQDMIDFIPNDCELVKGESWFQIITGPNMGGKSTFIRQVGTIVLMAQIGSFVPCDEAEISIRDAVYARVGAGDCQLRGVSTFMAEMLETAAILKGATSKSLVIIDELGRGTSTNDGFGLAWAISEHLMEDIGAPTLFATHFHELTEVKGSVGVSNLHVETDLDQGTGKLTMLYQVKPGPCNKSFGIAVAEKVMFPPEVIACARDYEKHLSKKMRLTV